MIEVQVDRYCDNCEEFEPKAVTGVTYKYNKNGDPERKVRTTIYCRHCEKCRAIYESSTERALEILKEED